MDEIKQKKKDILKNFDKYKVKWEELKEEIKKDETWGKIWSEKDKIFECASEYELSKKDLQGLNKKSQNKDEFIKELKEVFNQNQNKLKDFLTLEYLWRNRNLTEEIAREIIEDFDCVKVKKGEIHIVVSLPLGPFFKGKFEQKFQELRLTDDWKEFIGYDEKEGKIKWPLYQNGIFTFDLSERILEKKCYDIKAFRGITYNEILTPIYKLDKENKKDQITKLLDEIEKDIPKAFEEEKRKLSEELSGDELKEASKTLKSKEVFIKKVFGKIRKTLLEEEMWDIKVRLTKSGLVNLFFKKELKKNKLYDIKDFAEEKGKLLISPYSEEELTNQRFSKKDVEQLLEIGLLKKEQVFTSYLNAAAIWITHIFLKNCNLVSVQEIPPHIREIHEYIVTNLKDPWNVGYKAPGVEHEDPHTEGSPRHDMPPLRNYCVIFLLKDVEGMAWGFNKPLSTRVHFDCPGDIYKCEKRAECFIRYLGHSLLALSTNTYMIKEDHDPLKRPWFTQKELENFAKHDLSRWRGELCLIDSETILICTSSDIEMINKEGQKVAYDTYWRSIIKGVSLLVSCKTLAMDISRHLFDYIRWHRNNPGPEETDKILKRLNIISHLLSRARFIATPSNISRARYIREKLEAYIKAIGLPEIINNIEKDYDELNKAIHASIELKINSKILWLTVFMAVLTFVLIIMELYKK